MTYRGKQSLIQLAELLVLKGVNTAVLSPGSRNAPVIAALNRQPGIKCLSIIDERSAAFFALGIAQQTRMPVALSCTSGSAPLNYAPAIAEAYYQQVPLIVITADRPPDWIDQGDGQSIRQNNLYANYIRKSYQLPPEPHNDTALRFNARLINEAIDASMHPVYGPVHINIPLSEPLYDEGDEAGPPTPFMGQVKVKPHLEQTDIDELARIWNSSKSKLIITGLLPPVAGLNKLMGQLADDPTVVVFTETTSNLHGPHFFPHIDQLIEGFSSPKGCGLAPELLVTIGGHVVSRKVKAWLQQCHPKAHWHIAPGYHHMDTFRNLSLSIPMMALDFFREFIHFIHPATGDYRIKWQELAKAKYIKHATYMQHCPWSDLKAYELVLAILPKNCMIQAGNSTPVRYLQLFDMPEGSTCFGNRGVSGIDGVVSTAAGAAFSNPALTVLFVGDLSFLYDSNALWNRNLTPNLRIVVINNNGGNIFRIIEGPSSMPELETFIETPYVPDIRHIANMFGIDFYSVSDETGLKTCLPMFLDQGMKKSAILEIKTSNKLSAEVLKRYFQSLQS
ncbi:MAG: 2-succinyl-5-enolpyruvyl-6-hydroxy-3-cyclohexene-1-carboxylic-acid synthase [Bacteroidales bacterium]|nr:2-succinyl-5-enolpyruvyl-6-hydroxy-3-cyclohexene-1-carboxylic-acid synthase [Bacteroidales bacterium]